MARMPGATWQPKNVGSRSARRKGRCVVFHVAVSEAQSLMPGPSADWHFYVARDGRIYQYLDTDVQAWASGAANATAISVETQGGVNDPQGEPWSAAQVKSCAAIARWAHDTEGVPLRLMQSSLSTERGLGWHRLGCDPWRVAGGELWSSARGKICPGDAKIAQMPDVLRLALNGAEEEDDMTPNQDERLKHIEQIVGEMAVREQRDDATLHVTLAALGEVVKQIAAGKTSIDMAAVQKAVEQGVANAIESIDTTVRFDTGTA